MIQQSYIKKFMDPCGKATSSISDNLTEPHTLSQWSSVNFENHQSKMNDSISEKEIMVVT